MSSGPSWNLAFLLEDLGISRGLLIEFGLSEYIRHRLDVDKPRTGGNRSAVGRTPYGGKNPPVFADKKRKRRRNPLRTKTHAGSIRGNYERDHGCSPSCNEGGYCRSVCHPKESLRCFS